MQTEKQLVPKLRFSEFKEKWKENKLSVKIEFIAGYAFKSNQMKSFESKYQLIKMSNVYKSKLDLDRSPSYWDEVDSKTQKFLLKKKDILLTLTGTVGKKDYGYSVVIPKSNRFLLNQRLVCLRAKKNISDSDFINNLIKTSRFYYLFFAESKGGTGNQSNVGIDDLRNITLNFPLLPEQQKIANFLTSVDTQIQTLEQKKSLLEHYKKGVLQKIFKQELRFKDDDGNVFSEWEERKFADVLFEHKLKSTGKEDVHSVSVHKGVINQIEHLGRSFSAKDTSHYSRALPNDIIYTKSPTGDFPLGIIKQNHIKEDVIISPLYGVFTPETKELGYILHVYFESPINTSNYLSSIIQKGAKNTINITNTTFLSKKMLLPVSKDEQTKIANFLSALDKNIALVTTKIEHTKAYKKGLLQQMFV